MEEPHSAESRGSEGSGSVFSFPADKAERRIEQTLKNMPNAAGKIRLSAPITEKPPSVKKTMTNVDTKGLSGKV